MTIEQLYQEWFQYKKLRIKLSSLSTYSYQFTNHIEPYFKEYDIMQGVNNKQMIRFVDHLIFEKHLVVGSAQDVKNVLTNMLTFGNMQYEIPMFVYKIDYPTISTGRSHGLQFFSRDDCRTVFKAMENNPSSELLGIVIGLTTGMRIGELVGLRFEDVDFNAKTVSVNRTIERVLAHGNNKAFKDEVVNTQRVELLSAARSGRSAVIASSPKTASSRRTCPLTSLPLKYLRLYSRCFNEKRYIIGLSEKPIEPRIYRNIYYKILEDLGLPALHPHCMRHTFATQMLHNGVDPSTIASILGHSSPAITLEIYSHTNEEEKQKRVNLVFNKMFNS